MSGYILIFIGNFVCNMEHVNSSSIQYLIIYWRGNDFSTVISIAVSNPLGPFTSSEIPGICRQSIHLTSKMGIFFSNLNQTL
jgi:hypothetical protein